MCTEKQIDKLLIVAKEKGRKEGREKLRREIKMLEGAVVVMPNGLPGIISETTVQVILSNIGNEPSDEY